MVNVRQLAAPGQVQALGPGGEGGGCRGVPPTLAQGARSHPAAPADPCQNNPCLHGGTCRANGTVCGCSCAPGFTGENCEIGEWPEHPTVPGQDLALPACASLAWSSGHAWKWGGEWSCGSKSCSIPPPHSRSPLAPVLAEGTLGWVGGGGGGVSTCLQLPVCSRRHRRLPVQPLPERRHLH